MALILVANNFFCFHSDLKLCCSDRKTKTDLFLNNIPFLPLIDEILVRKSIKETVNADCDRSQLELCSRCGWLAAWVASVPLPVPVYASVATLPLLIHSSDRLLSSTGETNEFFMASVSTVRIEDVFEIQK